MAIWEEEDDVISPVLFRRRTVISVQRRSRPWIVAEEDDDPIKIVESDEMTCKTHYKCILGRNCINPNRKNGPLTVLVNQNDVLNCPICLDLLHPPIFQCENGDIVCSSCHSKLLEDEKKCPFCLMSIHNNIRRCHGLEKFIESISKISCKNAYNGCKKLLDYNNKSNHEDTCPYASCKCPYPSCYYSGLSSKVYNHFSAQHAASVIAFAYDTTFSVFVDIINPKKENHMMFLQEQNGNVVFVLHLEFQEQGQGGVFYLEFVGPGSLKHKFIYQLTAETVDSSLSLKSVPEMNTEWSSSSPRKNYISVPSGFADSNGFLSLSVSINERISSNSDQEVGDEFVNEYNLSNGSILLLTNPDVMNCSICLHPLFTPCFQYENGNIVCSICCSKVEKKCPQCFPIGYNYNRCRGIEKVTESSKDHDWLIKYFTSNGIPIQEEERNVSGRNWGSLNIQEDRASFLDDSEKTMFHLPVKDLSAIDLSGEKDLDLKFDTDNTMGKKDTLTAMSFYTPSSSSAMALKNSLESSEYVRLADGSNITEFKHVLVVAPRGMHNLKLCDKLFELENPELQHGRKKHVVRILYRRIVSMLVLPKPPGHTYVVISLDSPLDYGPGENVTFQQVVFQFNPNLKMKKSGVHIHVAVIELLEMLTGKRSIGPGSFLASDSVSPCFRTSMDNDGETWGSLYPLDDAILFLPSPVTKIHHDKIEEVEFVLTEATFNLVVTQKGAGPKVFRQIQSKEYGNMVEYVKSKGLKIRGESDDDAFKSKGFALYSKNRPQELMIEYPKRSRTSIEKEIKDRWIEMSAETKAFCDLIG